MPSFTPIPGCILIPPWSSVVFRTVGPTFFNSTAVNMVVFCSSIYLLAFICAPLSSHAQRFRGGGGGAPPAGFSVPNAPGPSVASIPQSVQPSSIPVVPNPTVIQQNPNVVQTSPAAVQSNPIVVQQKAAVVQASPSPGNSTSSQASTASSSWGACTGSGIEIQWSGDVVSYS